MDINLWPLLSKLGDTDSKICQQACDELVQKGTEAIPSLIDIVKRYRYNSSPSGNNQTIYASIALQKIGYPAVQPILNTIRELDDRFNHSGWVALTECLENMRREIDFYPILSPLIYERNPLVRATVVSMFSKTKDRRAIDDLIRLSGDDDEGVRCGVAFALGEIGDTRALPTLERMAQDSGVATWYSVKNEAIKAYRKIRGI